MNTGSRTCEIPENAKTKIQSETAETREGGKAVKGVFSPNPAFFQDLAQQSPHERTHVRASPRDCADALAQAARKI